MKKFVIRSVISFLALFIFVSAVSYVFYGYIVDGYVDKEVSDIVYVNSMSTRDLVNRQFTITNGDIHKFYNENKDLTFDELETKAHNDIYLKDYNIVFGTIDEEGLYVKDEVHKFNSFYEGQSFRTQSIFFLNYKEVFKNDDNIINVFFNLGDEKYAIIDSDLFFNDVLMDNNLYDSMTFLITDDGYIHYKSVKGPNTNFYEQFISDTSNSYSKKDFIKDIKSNKKGVINNFKFLGDKSYIFYAPLGTASSGRQFYILNIFYEDSLIDIKTDLIIPLIIMFVVLTTVLLLGIALLYAIALRKSSDIEASKMAMFYSKPYILKVNNKGDIKFKNISFNKLNIDFKQNNNVQFFEQLGDGTSIVDSIRKRQAVTIQMTNRDNHTYTFYMVPIKIGVSMYLLGQEVTTRYNELNELIKEVTYDELSGLPNKKILLKDLKDHLDYLNSVKISNPINSSLVIFNIQRLHRFVNIFGSKTADTLVLNFIEIVKGLMNENEKLYRIDQDKFAILFKQVEKYDDIISWIENLMVVLRKPISIDENQLMILIKSGIFNIELNMYEELDENKIYEYAEIAFNHANGLTSVEYMVYNISLGRLVKKEQLMEEDLKKAIENDEFIVYVQPQYNTNKNMIVGFEALTRWNNPKYLTDSPQHFIEMAEKNNMIVPIGRIITDQAFAIAKQLEKYNIEISINVSPAQMMQDGFVSQFIAICEKYQTNPEMIALEITETFLVENFKIVNEKLAVLKKYGFKIHLDDFGTGYSSLLYLKDLPIDAIKIDMEFTKYLNTDKSTRAIVSKVISLATSLNLDIIAEGVEDEKQSLFLNKSGCEIIQGWLIGKAMPVSDAIKLIEAYNIKKTKTLEMDAKPKKTRAKKQVAKKEGDK